MDGIDDITIDDFNDDDEVITSDCDISEYDASAESQNEESQHEDEDEDENAGDDEEEEEDTVGDSLSSSRGAAASCFNRRNVINAKQRIKCRRTFEGELLHSESDDELIV